MVLLKQRPRERIVAITPRAAFPFEEHNLFGKFGTGYYQVLE
jgi:hypothetical protein